jgi:hypothetical protein
MNADDMNASPRLRTGLTMSATLQINAPQVAAEMAA